MPRAKQPKTASPRALLATMWPERAKQHAEWRRALAAAERELVAAYAVYYDVTNATVARPDPTRVAEADSRVFAARMRVEHERTFVRIAGETERLNARTARPRRRTTPAPAGGPG